MGKLKTLWASLTRSTPAFGGPVSLAPQVDVQIQYLPNAVQTQPAYAYRSDAGFDLRAAEDVYIPAGQWKLVPTGLAMAIPDGYVGLVCPRSGMADRFGVTVLNAPGVVDSGYRGEVKVNLINHSRHPMTVERGDRIAQMLIQKVSRAVFSVVGALPGSDRGAGGHGSTGTRS